MIYLLFISGLAMLVVGAEMLVRGASRLAVLLGMSPLVIGLTVVAYGKSTQELACYAAYTAYLILNASDHDALPAYSSVLFGFVVPLTVLTLLVFVCREWKVARHHLEHP